MSKYNKMKCMNSKDKHKFNLSPEQRKKIEKIIEDYKELLVAVGKL